MDVPRPDGPDVDRGTNVFIGCWVLTGFVGSVLAFRYCVKAWMYWVLPKVSTPQRIWGYDDFFYVLGFAFDVGHMVMIWKSWGWGLGRHFYYLSPIEKNHAMMWDFISQPLAVSAAMWSRTGVIIFLYNCLAQNTRKIKLVIITCGVVQLIANLFTILQIFLQCGPNPYRAANRALYFHYMWDPLPEDGSVVCQPPTVQATIGYVQGAFNCVVDFTLTYLAGFEIWQIIFRTRSTGGGRKMSWTAHLRRLDIHVRNQRVWQTILLCGPLLLSGVASVIKTYLLSALGSRLDFTWNIVPFILWVKIENASIPIATCGPVLRLFARIFVDKQRNNSINGSKQSGQLVGLSDGSDNRNSRGFRRMSSKTPTFGDSLLGATFTEPEINVADNTQTPQKLRAVVKTEYGIRIEDDFSDA